MADEPVTPAPDAAAVDNDTSNAPVELTASQTDSKSLTADLDAEIESLWAKAEGREPETPATPEPVEAKVETAPAPEPPKTETTPPAPEIDRAAIEAEVRVKYEAEQQVKADAENKVRAEAEYRSGYEAYVGAETDYAAVNAALRAAQLNDYTLLDALDVTLPNGRKVSQVKPGGEKGLTPEEAAGVLNAWDQNRAYEDIMGTRKVAQVLDYWDAQTREALASPDVDSAAVRKFRTPGEQMKAAIDSTRTNAEKRKDAEYAPQIADRDKKIAEQAQRIDSLVNERSNLTSQQFAAAAASPDRPGQPGVINRDLPTPEEIARMSPEEFFKSGTNDRLLRSIQGGVTTRRAG